MNPAIIAALIGVLPGLLSLLGGNKSGTSQTQTTTALPTGYQSPFLGYTDAASLSAVLNNMNAFSSFGMPGGANRFGSYTTDILKNMPSIMGKLSDAAASGNDRPTCIKMCGENPSSNTGITYANCIKDCVSKFPESSTVPLPAGTNV